MSRKGVITVIPGRASVSKIGAKSIVAFAFLECLKSLLRFCGVRAKERISAGTFVLPKTIVPSVGRFGAHGAENIIDLVTSVGGNSAGVATILRSTYLPASQSGIWSA